ncbi:VanZ family protein [Streptomyces sp. MBT49]|uniref:VanZ family protein n=1 Tax=Streptomyces sp. MBT49 TaxID=1488380 RepID=UPI00190CAA2C|nr:VanZ family protein [Streptomyces sp. MBT49]MBK3626818.1 VanZ family protein [Streptomyces sp. MBT49]
MIEASISAVPGLIVSFLILAALIAAPTALVAKARNKPWPLRTALAVYLAGILAVTLLPGDAGLQSWQCDTGTPTHLFTSASSLLNIALFAPGALLAVLLFKRPVTVAAAFGALSAAVELAQSAGHLGRSCSVTDLAANATGALLGSMVGAVWLYRRRQPVGKPLRDLAWGMSLGVLAALSVLGVFESRIDRVDIVAMDDQRRGLAESAVQADEWIATAAKGVFGSDTQVRETATKKDGSRLRITATTDRGTISGTWPAKTLESAWSSNSRGDEGSLNKKEVAAAAAQFARKWFPQNVAGSDQQVRSIGDGPTMAYTVVYRRYADKVMMPMRLDLTVTTTGRVIGFAARTVDDPVLPRVTVDKAKAQALATATTGLPSESALLLAQQVKGEWRPVWLVGSGKQDIAIDAATGERIAGKV